MKINRYVVMFCALVVAGGCKQSQNWSSVGDDVYYSKKDAARERQRYLDKVNTPSGIVRKSEEQAIPGRDSTAVNAAQQNAPVAGLQQGTWNNNTDGQIIQGSYDSLSDYQGPYYNNSQGWYGPNYGYPGYSTSGYGYPYYGQGAYYSGYGNTPGFGFSMGYGFGYGNPFGCGLFGSPFSNGFYNPFCGPSFGMGWGTGYGYGNYGYGYNYGYSPYSNPYWYSPTYYTADPRPKQNRVPRTNGNTALPGTVYGNKAPLPVNVNRSVEPVGKSEPVNNGIQAGAAIPPSQQVSPGSSTPAINQPQATEPGRVPYNGQATPVPDAPANNMPQVNGGRSNPVQATTPAAGSPRPERAHGGAFLNFLRTLSDPVQSYDERPQAQPQQPQQQQDNNNGGYNSNRSYQPYNHNNNNNNYNSGNNNSGYSRPVYRQPSSTPAQAPQHQYSSPGSGSWGGGRTVTGGSGGGGSWNGGGAGRGAGGGGTLQNRSHR